MYIYNVTTNIENAVHDEWLKWMKEIHIPDMLATGKFLSAKMCKVLVEEEMGGTTYSVQFTTADKKTLDDYYVADAPRLREDAMRRFANQFVAFRTELEVISEQLPVAAVATHNLFTYGTLQDEKVQLYTFSRKLMGTLDRLENYNLSDHLVAGAYPTIHPTENADDYVSGQVYVLTHEELLKADTYEGNGYRRIEVMLSSGKKAWVYFSA